MAIPRRILYLWRCLPPYVRGAIMNNREQTPDNGRRFRHLGSSKLEPRSQLCLVIDLRIRNRHCWTIRRSKWRTTFFRFYVCLGAEDDVIFPCFQVVDTVWWNSFEGSGVWITGDTWIHVV